MLRSRNLRYSSSIRVQNKFPKTLERSLHNPQDQKSNIFQICQCALCDHRRTHNSPFKSNLSKSNLSQTCLFDKTSLEILLSSLLGKNKKKGLNINIPQTCFYKNGKPDTMYINNLQEIKLVSVKKLSSKQVLQDFLKRRLQTRLNTNKISHKSTEMLQSLHQKVFEKLYPSHLQQITSKQLKQKVYVIHQDNKLEIFQQKHSNNNQCCVSYFSNGSISILQQNQFKLIRNDSKYFTTLQYLQILVPSVQTVISEFNEYSCINQKRLYDLARQEVDRIIQQSNIFNKSMSHRMYNSDFYQQFNRDLKINNQKSALYQTFKIIHYITKTSNIIILSLKLNWSITKDKHIYLLNVIHMNYKKRQVNQIKNIINKQLTLIKNKNNQQYKNIKSMEEIMLKKWNVIKVQNNLVESEQKNKDNKQKNMNHSQIQQINLGLYQSQTMKTALNIRHNKILPRLFKNRSVSRRQFI